VDGSLADRAGVTAGRPGTAALHRNVDPHLQAQGAVLASWMLSSAAAIARRR
jgi:hypothetical protein